ncbi:MAG: GntR family transcriptional regulator [Candidatus Atribacteria bacterium]|nr:GntR family transcriptional regulator [Candidatus Atribacteria bacterium]
MKNKDCNPLDFLKNKNIDKSIPVPLYYQLKEILLEYIKNPNNCGCLPTEIEICKHYDISRPTVRQAINELVTDGYLERVKGKGTLIVRTKINQDYLLVIESFNEEMREKGLVHKTKVLEFEKIPANETISSNLQIKLESEVIKLIRLRSINDEPTLYVKTYLPSHLFQGLLNKDLENNSLYQIIENDYGYQITKSIRTIEAIKADEPLAKLLHIQKGDPIQYIESVSFLNEEIPFEYTLAFYRGNRNKFRFVLTNKKNKGNR